MKTPPKWSFDKRIASWFRDSDGTWIRLADGWSRDGLHTLHVELGGYVAGELRKVVRCDATCGACADARRQP